MPEKQHLNLRGAAGTLRKLYTFLDRRQKAEFAAVLLILAVSAALAQYTPLAVGYLTDHLLAEQTIRFATVIPLLASILAVNVGNEVIKVVRRLLVEDTATYVERTARLRATMALLRAPLLYFRRNMTGNIHGRLNRNLEGTSKLVKLVFMDFAPALASGVAAIAVIFAKLPVAVAFSILLVIPMGTFIVARQISTQNGIRVELMNTRAAMDGTMVELLGGIETIRILDSADGEGLRIDARSRQLRNKEMKHHKAMAFYDCLKFINEAVFHVLVIAVSVWLAATGSISIGTVLTAYLCFTQLTSPLRELHRILDEFSESLVLADDYFRIVELAPDFSFSVSPDPPRPELPDGSVTVEEVSFHYPEKPDVPVLQTVSVQVRPGEFVGIAGPSGGGKSTLIKLMARLEPCEGKIWIGPRALNTLSRAELAAQVSLVPQTPFLVADTIRRNICYGMDRPVTDEQVRRAARQACLDQVIEALPGKYDFVVAEGGANLSGGQRQRIALARVFLREPRVLILDEATSALDNTSERYIQQEIEAMKERCGTTVISIAHRLTTLQNCDEILVMDKGRIVQRGSFAALSAQPGIFRDMQRGLLK